MSGCLLHLQVWQKCIASNPYAFFSAPATLNLTLFTAPLQLFCKHIYKSSSVLWWIHDSSSLPQAAAAYISRRKLELRARWRTVRQVDKKLSKCLSITKQELGRVYTSPLLFTNSFLMFSIYPLFTLSSHSSNSSLPPTSCCSGYTRQNSLRGDVSQDGD